MKLSVIIPVYNVEPYLRKCLESVLYPELEGYEVLVVNDGSRDGSPAIIGEYEARYPNLIRRIDTPNGGLGHARNTGIAAAQGEYLAFLDGDDYLNPGALPAMLTAADESCDILFFDMRFVSEAGQPMERVQGCGREGEFTLAEYPELLHDPPNACNKLFRRRLFTDTGIRFPDRLWFEDLCTIPRLYPHAEKMAYAASDWYQYVQRGGSITNSVNAERNLEIIQSVDITLNYYRDIGLYEAYAAQLEYMAFHHQLLSATVRVNGIDRKSAVQDRLREDFISKFPGFAENPYVRAILPKHKLLIYLIRHRQYFALNQIMALNRALKGK